HLAADFDPTVVAAIDTRLQSVGADHHARILLAVESGSRAWGFPSPDSDFDCRFIYVRRSEEYLSLFPPRDVIEFPLDPLLDVNGWDLGKALRLLLKGNAVVIEWLTAPFIYAGDKSFRVDALALARQVARPAAVMRHYLHLGERQRRTYFSDDRAVPFKKLFYALRPAVALRWLRLHPGQAVAPMHFPTLVGGAVLRGGGAGFVGALLARGGVRGEWGGGPLRARFGPLMDAGLAQARTRCQGGVLRREPKSVPAANGFF